ncbi:MAG: primosomal protein N', partial [Prevotellaceae bacterium]|nr:primosomal protein N' [Prevotellaceae bacterium]
MKLFVKVLLPLYLDFDKIQTPLYSVPADMADAVKTGIRVSVPLGNRKLYSGIIIEICESVEVDFVIKDILDILDKDPIVTDCQIELWKWIANYYMCTLGEVMRAALPAGFRLESETRVSLNVEPPKIEPLEASIRDSSRLPSEQDDTEQKIIENLLGKQLSMDDLVKKVNRKNILPVVKKLLNEGIINIDEKLTSSYKDKYQSCITLHPNINSEEKLNQILNSIGQAAKQKSLLLEYIKIAEPLDYNAPPEIPKNELLTKAGISAAIYKSCEKKEIFISVNKKIDRIKNEHAAKKELPELSIAQQKAFEELNAAAKPALFYGITSSGKTEVYIRLIDEILKRNKQVLYLLPEIALTTQIIDRLRIVFGNKVGVYHSNFNNAERTEIYNNLLNLRNETDKSYVILGVRSSLLLPFNNLGLIIVDEEHETTYKQSEPAPRYNARDAAVVLGKMHGARVILGSATPSLESFYNAIKGKYDLVKLTERYGDAELPAIRTIDMRRAYGRKKVISHFSETLLNLIREKIAQKEQIIIFQNRRGFSPFIQCENCGFTVKCKHCDVSLTYHKYNNLLSCHYCGYSISMPTHCPSCHSADIKTKGFGTEKIEDELSILIPEINIARLDLDSVQAKFAYEKILHEFESHKIDILIGTQMITKGLDFDNVSLVGIMNADNLLNFPDFRAYERSFQLMSQVAGRAGRKDKRGEVIIQTSMPENPVIRQVINHDYESFFKTQISERHTFNYPPFCRLIILSIRHPKQETVQNAGKTLKITLQNIFGKEVAGPEPPPVGRIQNKYILNFRIKLKKDTKIERYKQLLIQT